MGARKQNSVTREGDYRSASLAREELLAVLVRPRWSRATRQLVQHIAHSCQPSLQSELGTWIQSRPRFAEFASRHRDKIRKKFTTAADREVRFDVRAELLVAYLVLADRRFEVSFEAAGAARGGPDLGLRYRAKQTVNLEVTRLRSAADPLALASVIAAKSRQMTSGVPNGLVIAGRDLKVTEDVLVTSIRQLKARAESKDDGFFTRRGLRDARDFHAHFHRLSSIFILDELLVSVHFANPETRHPIPDELLARLRASLGIMAAVPTNARTPA